MWIARGLYLSLARVNSGLFAEIVKDQYKSPSGGLEEWSSRPTLSVTPRHPCPISTKHLEANPTKLLSGLGLLLRLLHLVWVWNCDKKVCKYTYHAGIIVKTFCKLVRNTSVYCYLVRPPPTLWGGRRRWCWLFFILAFRWFVLFFVHCNSIFGWCFVFENLYFLQPSVASSLSERLVFLCKPSRNLKRIAGAS